MTSEDLLGLAYRYLLKIPRVVATYMVVFVVFDSTSDVIPAVSQGFYSDGHRFPNIENAGGFFARDSIVRDNRCRRSDVESIHYGIIVRTRDKWQIREILRNHKKIYNL